MKRDRDWIVDVIYRNERLEPVYRKAYSLDEYTEMLRVDLLKVVTDVEDQVYELHEGKPKSEWGDSAWTSFCRIKHKLLDKAGDIGRLPENLRAKDATRDINAFIKDVLDGCDP